MKRILGSFARLLVLLLSVVLLVACSSTGSSAPDVPTVAPPPRPGSSDAAAVDPLDASDGGAVADAGRPSKAAACTGTFGNALTSSFGRADGTVLAVVTPADQQCPRPNSDHVVLEITMAGKAYRMVINVQSDFAGDVRVRMGELSHALPAPAWQEGWHTGVALDYANTLGAHSTSGFTPYDLQALVGKISDALTIGDKVSVYAWSSGGDSAHKIHRNAEPSSDGAIVTNANGPNPKFLLFHFDQQAF